MLNIIAFLLPLVYEISKRFAVYPSTKYMHVPLRQGHFSS